jgi:hypothetical protein
MNKEEISSPNKPIIGISSQSPIFQELKGQKTGYIFKMGDKNC